MTRGIIDTAVFVLTCFVSLTEAYMTCGNLVCYGWSSYCCGVLDDECCNYSVYQFWWFWLIWLSFFLMIISCSCWCYRRRRYRPQYITVSDGRYPPNYGTVVVTPPPAYPAQHHQIGATAPIQPPTYQTSNEKPPAYVP